MFSSRLSPASLQVVDWRPLLLGPRLTDARRLSGVDELSGLQIGNSLALSPGDPDLQTSSSTDSLHVFLKTSVVGDHEKTL